MKKSSNNEVCIVYRGADKSLARPTSRCILFDGGNISFVASLVLYIYIYIYIHTHTHTHRVFHDLRTLLQEVIS